MPRHPRSAPGGYVYHALNRGIARLPLFQKVGDYEIFERVLVEALAKHPIRLLSYCVMPNHWHFVLWPTRAGELTAFLRWLTHTHTQRWHAHHHTSGTGHLYQGRFKSFPVEKGNQLYGVLRYVEGNPLRAGLVTKTQAWRWSSLWHRGRPAPDPVSPLLHAWPTPLPDDWLVRVNRPQREADLAAVRLSVARGQPYGSEDWQKRVSKRLGLQYTFRPRGRPRKEKD